MRVTNDRMNKFPNFDSKFPKFELQISLSLVPYNYRNCIYMQESLIKQ